MRMVDAWWDTRSLDVRSAELIVEDGDDVSDISDAIAWASAFGYVVIKVPAAQAEAMAHVQSQGFTYAESSLAVSIDLRKVKPPSFIERREAFFTNVLATEETSSRVFNQIMGGIFDTDRVALDPAFGPQVAAKRYVNWIKDELGKGSSLYHVFYKENEIAFFTMKEIEPGVECYPFLTGLYPGWKNSGLGANATVVTTLREAQRLGYRRIKTSISSNNVPIIRIHEMLGFRVEGISHVFVRHALPADNESDGE